MLIHSKSNTAQFIDMKSSVDIGLPAECYNVYDLKKVRYSATECRIKMQVHCDVTK